MSSHRKSGVDHFRGPRRPRGRRGVGFVSMETSSVDDKSVNRPKKTKKIKGGSSLWHCLCFFLLFFIFLNVFFFLSRIFSVTILISKLEVQSHRKKHVSSVKMPRKTHKKKKRHCIFTSRSFGATRLFSGSPHSLHTWVSHGSVFSWSVTWLVIYWQTLRFKKCVCVCVS